MEKPSKQQQQRFRNLDYMPPAGGQADPQHQKMVADIEALQQRQGWLAGRGAFDKDDLLYLRDKEQEQRHQEHHKRDAEAAAFAAARAAAEAQAEAHAAKLLRQQQQQAEATRPQSKARRAPLLSVVRPVKPQSQQHQQQQLPEGPHTSQPLAAMQQQQQKQSVNLHPAKRLRVDAETASAGPQPPLSQHSALPAEPPLQNLLGDYGSEGESDEDPQQPAGGVHPVAPKTKLPSAEQLLESDLASTLGGGGRGGGAHPGDALLEAAVLAHCGARRGLQPQAQGSWV